MWASAACSKSRSSCQAISGARSEALTNSKSPKTWIHGTSLVYLPAWMVDPYGFHVGKYTIRPMDGPWVFYWKATHLDDLIQILKTHPGHVGKAPLSFVYQKKCICLLQNTVPYDQGFEQRLTGYSLFKRQVLLCTHYKNRFYLALHYLCLSIQESGHGNATWPFLKRERKLIPSDPHNRGSVLQSVRVACNMHQWLWCHHWRQHSNQGFFGLISCGFGDALVTNFDGRKSVATSQKGIHWLCFYSSEGRKLAIPSNNQDWMKHLKPNLKVD